MPDRQTAPPPRTRSDLICHIAQIENKDRLGAEDYALLNRLRTELAGLPEERPTLADLLATPDAFRAWLRAQAEDRTFKARRACFCPLAKFLVDELGDKAAIGRSDVTAGPQSADLPPWAARFVAEVDAAGDAAPITAARCLGILRHILVGE